MGSGATARGRRALRQGLALAVAGLAIVLATGNPAAGATGMAHRSGGFGASGLRQVPGGLPGISLASLRHPLAAGQTLQIGVGISRPDPAGEQALVNALYDSASPLYHHFLTVAQFNARFGVAPATTAAVRRFLTAGGLDITSTSAGGDYFTAAGTVAQLDRLFHVQIADYGDQGTRFYAANTDPSVPANLPIDGVAGLENLTHFSLDTLKGRRLARAGSARAAIAVSRRLLRAHRHRVHSALGLPVTVSHVGTEQTYTPQDLWGFYNAPGAAALTDAAGFSNPTTVARSRDTLGQGQIMGIFTEGEDSSVIRQLRLFETTLGLPKVPVRIVETEGRPDSAYSDNSGSVEWYLDSQASTGMAPDVRQLDLFTAKTFQDADVAKEFDYWANDPTGPREMNASFGECEENPTAPITGPLSNLPAGVGLGGMMENLADPFLRQAVIEGRTLFASAGDTGSGCPSLVAPLLGGGNGLLIQPVPFQNYPCISAYVVCVGGTTPSSAGAGYPKAARRANEQAWTYTGGGSSYFNPAPSFQQAVANIDIHCVSNDLGTTVYPPGQAPLCRGVPDVADMSGGGNDFFFFYQDGEPSVQGGTSLASPLMMGQWARVQAAASRRTQATGGLGFADPVIYRQAASADHCTSAPCGGTYGRDFFDITEAEDVGDVPGGQLGVAVPVGVGLSNGVYAPGPGWDYVSGWGSLNDANFIHDVDGRTTATDAYTGQERAAVAACTVRMSSPLGNATDQVTSTNDPGLDLSAASLTTHGSSIVATLTIPDLKAGLPLTSATGATFSVAWSAHGQVDYAVASEADGGHFSYDAGTTGAPFAKGLPVSGTYTNTATVAGSADPATGRITITVPAADVGSPRPGALLVDPQAFSQEQVATLALTVDSADTLRNWSVDDGQLDSIGANVVMDGIPGRTCATTLPRTSTITAGTGVLGSGATSARPRHARTPEIRLTSTAFSSRGIRLLGAARAFDGHRVRSVGVALARVRRVDGALRCAFLTARGRFTRLGDCRPHDYLAARGTVRWRFERHLRLLPGVYFLWERAVDSHGLATDHGRGRHVSFRIR